MEGGISSTCIWSPVNPVVWVGGSAGVGMAITGGMLGGSVVTCILTDSYDNMAYENLEGG